ncbi:Hypothetical protein CINCED_3A010052 [Cinara cedri]|uniref:Uncharacterized protein n=1 Tax=Cinara cedri TaxID=506608 RepID=A0A5E4MTA9_9HEMI|nr:Hypothetical protein CINCED_3A010052 [Cinara cedri]
MVAYKALLAVAIAMSVAQINARPTETKWTEPFESALKNLTTSISGVLGENGQKATDLAKNNYNEFVNNFKSGLASLSKTFEGKTGVSDVVKEATKQWESAVDKYSKNLPQDLTPAKLTEKFEKSLKYITDNATELSNKAKGNSETEKEIREFTKKQIDSLFKHVEDLKNSLGENKTQ